VPPQTLVSFATVASDEMMEKVIPADDRQSSMVNRPIEEPPMCQPKKQSSIAKAEGPMHMTHG